MPMSVEAKELRNRYKREWYRAHPGKATEYQKRYWEKQAQKLKQGEHEKDVKSE